MSYRPSSLIFHTMDTRHTHTWSLSSGQSFSQHDHRSNYHLHHCILDISCWSRELNAWATRFWVSIYLSIHIATHFWKKRPCILFMYNMNIVIQTNYYQEKDTNDLHVQSCSAMFLVLWCTSWNIYLSFSVSKILYDTVTQVYENLIIRAQ